MISISISLAIYTTRPNIQERNHVNKLWLWDEPDVRKISMSMDWVGKLCIPQLTHQWLVCYAKWMHLQLYHGVNSEYIVTVYHNMSTIWAISLCEQV